MRLCHITEVSIFKFSKGQKWLFGPKAFVAFAIVFCPTNMRMLQLMILMIVMMTRVKMVMMLTMQMDTKGSRGVAEHVASGNMGFRCTGSTF